MKHSRLVAAPFALLIAAGAVTGCSSSTDTKTSGSQSATSSSSSTSSAATGDVKGAKVPAAKVAERMTNALMAAKTAKAKVDMGGLGTMDMKLTFTDGKSNTEGSFNMSGLAMDIISLNNGEEMYLKAPAMQVTNWTKVDANSTNPVIKQMAGQMQQMKGQMDPTSTIKMYAQAGDFTSAGQQELNGTKVTKYTGTIPGKVLAQASGAAASGATIPDMPVEVYLDDKDRPIQQVMSMNTNGQTIKITSTYSDFGAPIEIKAPATN